METIDTYDMPLALVEEADKLAAFRDQAKEEANKPRVKMTDRAAAHLRAIGEHDRANKAADAKLTQWFNDQSKTVESLMDVMYAISSGYTKDIRKRAIKCFYMMSRGMKVYTIHDVMFLGSLLPEEENMALTKILSRYPIDEEKVISPVEPEAPEVRLCLAGKECLRYEHRKAAPAKGSGYCSTACAASVRARAKRALTAIPTVQ